MAKNIAAATKSRPDEADTAAAAVVHQVLDTTELFENILLFLPLKDLLLAQRISPRFRDSIKASKNIQQALFLAPLSRFAKKWTAMSTSMIRVSTDNGTDKKMPIGYARTPSNPLLNRFPTYKEHSATFPRQMGFSTRTRLHDAVRAIAHSNWTSNPSWRRMLVVQPGVGNTCKGNMGRLHYQKGSTKYCQSLGRRACELVPLVHELGSVVARDPLDFEMVPGVEFVHLGEADVVCGWDILRVEPVRGRML
ncbi:hypothetical protein LTR37_002168 [Vermiconidia calcicola]|uniref:Uncharacterized protein n=1 Tax=Vermiconidia calcicola TaxID=1690605 RepID=A0ACC3NUQ9_9PEZI|nr:hypothetical protein LTR37_002168 [Vermiconidia calcicola]